MNAVPAAYLPDGDRCFSVVNGYGFAPSQQESTSW